MTDTTTTAQPGPDGSPPGHLAAMEAKSAGLPQNTGSAAPAAATPPATGIPKDLPPEFLATYEAWKTAQGTKTPEAPKPAGTPQIEKPAPTAEEANKTLTDAGLKMEDFSAEFAKSGALSAESYEKLSKAGIPKEMVDGYIAGQTAIVERNRADLLSTVGGEKGWADISGWATKNVSPADLTTLNTALASGNAGIQKLALADLQTRYRAAVGQDPALVRAANGVPSGSETFASRAQHVAAMRDPRYAKDPAYRAEVEQKAMRSTF